MLGHRPPKLAVPKPRYARERPGRAEVLAEEAVLPVARQAGRACAASGRRAHPVLAASPGPPSQIVAGRQVASCRPPCPAPAPSPRRACRDLSREREDAYCNTDG